MATFSVETTVLKQKATQLDRHAEDFDSICARLKQAATTMGSAYDSDDNRKFISRVEACCTDLKALSDKLRTASQIITAQANEYDSREASNTAAASRLPG